MRRVVYLTGTRADFGLMQATLLRMAAHPDLTVEVVVTGMHLSAAYGMTVREIEATGLKIAARIPSDVDSRTSAGMSCAIGEVLVGLTQVLVASPPDVLLILGDRGEMLAGAIAGIHLGCVVAHLHGGERSGTVDELVRHAITKLSHWHFVATEESRQRVVRMGESPEHVWVTGAPALDDLSDLAATPRAQVLQSLGLPSDARYALVLFHPVMHEMDGVRVQTRALADGLVDALPGYANYIVWLAPNADAGSNEILRVMEEGLQGGALSLVRLAHLPRSQFVAATKQALVLVGNSSAGIIEAASLGTPVVNVGNRQRARERNDNCIDCEVSRASIAKALHKALHKALDHGPWPPRNRYGEGNAGERITQLLATLPIGSDLLDKVNTY